jgi:hypothetical protein
MRDRRLLRDGPENFYQFDQWRMPLEHLALQRPVFVIVDRPDTGDLVLVASSCPSLCTRQPSARRTGH